MATLFLMEQIRAVGLFCLQHYALAMLTQFVTEAQNDALFGKALRERTVPIPASITPVPGYPKKLVVFKMAASKYWQVRCWLAGKTYKRSTQSQSLRVAQVFAIRFYEQLLAQSFTAVAKSPLPNVQQIDVGSGKTQAHHTFGALAAQMMANEQARVQRGEFSVGSLQILQNRLDAHILPRWRKWQVNAITANELLTFAQFLSQSFSTTTVSQYLIAVRKVLGVAVMRGLLDKLPEFPKIRVISKPRGAFTPSEYWKLIRTARKLSGQSPPDIGGSLRKTYRLRTADFAMPKDIAWVIGFMVHSFIRPSDLKTLKHRHVEVVRNSNTYLRLTLPETKKHGKPIVTLQPAVRIYEQIVKQRGGKGLAKPDDYVFLPHLQDRNYAHWVLSFYFNWVLQRTGLKQGPHGQDRSLYSLRHSAITFRLLYGQGIDLLTLARNARTSVEVINNHYASTVSGEQNISLLQSRRSRL